MATKNKPGAYDCYERADPDTEMFTLLSTDDLASPLVEMWAALRDKDFARADQCYTYLIALATARPETAAAKVYEAYQCSKRMALQHAEKLAQDVRQPMLPGTRHD